MTEEALFHEALARTDPAERAAYLAAASPDPELRRRVEALLGAHAKASGVLEEPAGRTGAYAPSAGPTTMVEGVGTVIGPYKLLQQLGEGGMGAVYMAEQQRPVRRMVALKVIKPGLDSRQVIARFEAERQALALMDHPNIAKVLDAGTTEQGRPFFVMELVKGIPITKYCDQQHLTPRERLELFIPVCQAIQHAHQKGVIHRDLKPSNVLIALYDGRPVPKVIDFGVAKALHQKLTERTMFTEFGQVVGTLEYMSPEQAELNQLDIDTRSDVYSLGVLLYELLTGSTPISRLRLRGAAFDEMLRIIREEEPHKPSTRLSGSDELPSIAANRRTEPKALGRLVRGELDWIVMRCLEKDRARRYETANGVARDVQRYLADEPVEAGPPSAGYRLVKFARKNRRLLATMSAFALLLTAAAGVNAWLAVRANRSAERADAEASNAQMAAAREKDRADGEQKARRESQRLLGLINVDQGLRDADEGRLSFALLQMAQQLIVDPDNADGVEMTRDRLANYRRYEKPGFPILTRLWCHSGAIFGAAFSPDGRRVATTSADKTARIWDAATGHPLTPPLAHDAWVGVVAFSPDGRHLITGSEDKTARVWDAATGQPVTPSLPHGGKGVVGTVAFSRDGRRVLTQGPESARVWDAATGQPLTPPLLQTGPDRMFSAALSSDGRLVVTGSEGKTARVWDAATGLPVMSLDHGGLVPYAEFSPDGRRIVTSGEKVRVWDAATGQAVTPFFPVTSPHSDEHVMNFAGFSPDGRRIVTASHGKAARVWDAATGQPLTPPLAHLSSVLSARFSPDGRRIVTASEDQTVRLWDAATGQALTPPLAHGSMVNTAVFSPDGRRLLTSSSDKTARIWDLTSCQPIAPPLKKEVFSACAVFSPDGRRVLTTEDKTARVWDRLTGQPLTPPIVHEENVGSPAFSPDGRRLLLAEEKAVHLRDAVTGQPAIPPLVHGNSMSHAVFSPDGQRVLTVSGEANGTTSELRIWEAVTGQLLTPAVKHERGINHAEFSPDGRRVVTASKDGMVRLWYAATGQPAGPTISLGRSVFCAAFGPDGRRLVTGDNNFEARVWDAVTGEPVTPPLKHGHDVDYTTFSPDGRGVLTVSRETARVWDAATGQPLTPTIMHGDLIMFATFSADGRRVLTASFDITRVWDAATGQPLAPPLMHRDSIPGAGMFSPDGCQVVTPGAGDAPKVWNLTDDHRAVGDLVGLAQLFSSHRIDDSGVAVALTGEELQPLWDDLRAKYPADFTVSPAAARAWREREIGDCLKEGNLAAAEFLYWWLVAEMAMAARPVK